MSAALGLDPLLAALREAGLPVGVAEMARLQQVFALGPRIEEDRRLKSILGAVLVKSVEDRARFEPVFDAWVGRAGQEVAFREAPPPPQPGPVTRVPQRGRYSWTVLALVVLVAVVPTLLILAFLAASKTPPEIFEPTPKGEESPSSSTPSPATPIPAPPEPPKPGNPVWRGWPAFSLGGLALLAAGGLWLALRRRRWLPEPAPEPEKKGPPRVFLAPPLLTGPQLLKPREEETLVWGISHFISDEPTHRLDLPATVRETARAGGITHTRFHQARYPREVWLWVDEAADDTAIPRIIDEIEAALQAYGLPAERALFRGVPDRLVNATGQVFAPNEVDERRDAALVAILTDGRILARQYAADDRRVRLDALLRSLSHWPRLAFVDFSATPGDLTAILAKHSISKIDPDGLAAFLGRGEGGRRPQAIGSPDDLIWAAACALAPSSMDEAWAFEIRHRLRLRTSPWALRALRAEAPGSPGRLQWQPEIRARRVNWLREAEAPSTSGVAPESRLEEALDFWERAYDQELRGREKDDGEGTPAYRRLAMERALLALWRDAPRAIRQLYRLYTGELREIIQRHLREMAPLGWGGPERLHLPWTWAERSGAEQVMLQEMRLGGGMSAVTLRRPGRLWLGLGLCLGLAAGAFSAAFYQRASCWNGEILEENGMTFVRVCPNTFTMGSADNDPQAFNNEKPAHQVTLGEYWIGRTEVTNAQYRSDYPDHKGLDSLPVTGVTWNEAKYFCERHGWRLPTEAEWEYAGRAGTRTPWSFEGDERQLGEYAWFMENSNSEPHPVATKKPNPWGLYDVHGNVWEWVEDWFGPYEPSPQMEPRGPATGETRTLRGGSFGGTPGLLRSAIRGGDLPQGLVTRVGFRCARSPRRQP